MDNFCGKRLDGRYEIREIIGVGGMAVVYKAYDNIDDRIVAIKILKDEYLSNEEFKRRFKNESKAIAVLSHPNIVRVYNVSFGDRLQYIVMEYVDGITLKEYIEQQGVINWKEAVHFTGQILAALQHAHDKGIVHQDVKPQNILLLQDGTIKVTDFGIARFSRMDNNTTSEKAIGSVHYISPEQARGEMTDDKADIYSVGVVMYEMLTGTLPFQSDNAVSVALMQLQQDPKRLRELNPNLPLGLEQITMRAMRKNPNDRYRSSAEMLMDINEFKRNPSVKFNYTYFVDQDPTKYVRSGAPIRNTPEREPIQEAEAKSGLNKTTAVMLGAVAGIVVLAIVIIAVLFGMGSKKVEVPNFVNKNYYTQIENESKYTDDFDFELKYVEDSSLEDGTVVEQNPEASVKVEKGSTITLTIVQKDGVVLDSSISGMNEEQVKDYLTNMGIIYKIIPEYAKDVVKGTVLRTEPAIGSTVRRGSTVTVYIATDIQEKTKVPPLVGCTQDMAEQLLHASGLQLGTVTEVDSDLESGIVVSQSIENDTEVPLETKIDIEISSGKTGEATAEITVVLPNTNETGTLTIYLNSEFYSVTGQLLFDGATKTYQITGKGANNNYKVVDSKNNVIQEGTIDFTQSPPSVVIISDNIDTMSTIPNTVIGSTEDEAKTILSTCGFKNVDITYADSTEPAGIVIGISHTADGSTKHLTSDTIVLTVSNGSNAA